MALVALNGELEMNSLAPYQGASFNAITAITTLNTTKVHMIGRFWNKDAATKNITKIYFRLGTITINAGSVLQASIQAISAASGPPGRGDGSVIQSGTIAGSSLSSNGMFSVTLGSSYSATYGSAFAVVLQLTTFNASDSIVVNSNGSITSLEGFCTFESATPTFTVSNTSPIVLFECDDGTFGTFYKTLPVSSVTSIAYNSGSAADEIALEFSVPFPCTISGLRALLSVSGASADFDVKLYSGTTVLATGVPTLDATTVNVTASQRIFSIQFPETDLTAGTTYAVSFLPTTANSISVYYHDVPTANAFQAHMGETSWGYKTRVDAGAWSGVTTTRRPAVSLLFSRVDDGTGGGGGTGVSRGRVQGGM